MSYTTIHHPTIPLVQPDLIPLDPGDFQQAIQLSDAMFGERCQWQTYLQGLALMGFTSWLRERSPNLPLRLEDCSLWQPAITAAVPLACKLSAGPFSLCLLAVEQVWDEQVKVPRAVLELPEFMAHFYVVVEVQEELEQTVIQGFARFDQLEVDRCHQSLPINADWSYSFPLNCFDPEPNHLLLYLQMLDPAAIVLSRSKTHPGIQTALTSVDLPQLLTGLRSADGELWEYLSWEQGKAILQNPELRNLYYQWRQSPTVATNLDLRFQELLTLALHRAVQLGRWFQGELDEVAACLGLFFPPTVAAVAPMLSIDRFEAAIVELRNQGMDIPPQPSRAYQDLDWQDVPLRLCVITWPQPMTAHDDRPATSSVLFLLGMQTNTILPTGLKLRVSHAIGTLHEPVADFDDPFLFARVQGQPGDTFVVTICHINCPPLTLAPYQITLAP